MANTETPPNAPANKIIAEPMGLLRVAASLPSVIYAVIVAPKPFFGAIGAATRLSVLNAVAFFVVTITLYSALLIALDQSLLHLRGNDAQSFSSYYAEPFRREGFPLAEALGILAALGDIAIQPLLAVAQWTASIWILATAFIHTGKIASPKAMLVAGLYAAGAIILVFSVLSLPAAHFDLKFNPQAFMATPGTLLYDFTRFATAAGLNTKYELIFTYLYLRAVSFTTDLRLHWGLVFTILAGAVIILIQRAF